MSRAASTLALACALVLACSEASTPSLEPVSSEAGVPDASLPPDHEDADADAASSDAAVSLDAALDAGDSGPLRPSAVFVQEPFTTLFAVSDVHAHLEDLATLLIAAGLVDAISTFPDDLHWSGGDATLVVAGDLIDKGPSSLGVLTTCQTLQTAAAAAGGSVVVLLGNHEAEFFATPSGPKFQGSDRIGHELAELIPPITPEAFAAGTTPLSAWLRARPVAAKIGSWFFAHGGNSGGASIAELDARFSSAPDFSDPAYAAADSLLEGQAWYTSEALVDANLAALGVSHVAFGHDPGAFGKHGKILLNPDFGVRLVKLDTGLGNDDGHGEMLRVRKAGAEQVVEAIRADGSVRELSRGAP